MFVLFLILKQVKFIIFHYFSQDINDVNKVLNGIHAELDNKTN